MARHSITACHRVRQPERGQVELAW